MLRLGCSMNGKSPTISTEGFSAESIVMSDPKYGPQVTLH
jgi:hypothetical protein